MIRDNTGLMSRADTLSTVSSQGEAREEISEEMIEFVKMNPRVMRRWQSLAHSAGLSHRVEVIKARIRSEGRDMDEHVEEFLREWMEYRPEAASLAGLIEKKRITEGKGVISYLQDL